MRPDKRSRLLLSVTQSKAKMYEYGLPETEHIRIPRDPSRLLRLAVALLGDLAATAAVRDESDTPARDRAAHVRFSARFFDAYFRTRMAQVPDVHLKLLAAASYYLCDFPGTSSVLISGIDPADLNLGARGLEGLTTWLLAGDYGTAFEPPAGMYARDIKRMSQLMVTFFASGQERDQLFRAHASLRQLAYHEGTPRELLFADTAAAITVRRIAHSARECLPRYSKMSADAWGPALAKDTFVREIWPAQRLVGEKGVFEGKSAIIQMPTSSGKSRATEITIRSAFLAGRASLAVVVAPFRALGHEIRESLARAFSGEPVTVNELSDVFQPDVAVQEITEGYSVVVVTPEKLVYVLRHSPELAHKIGLLILDEGHQFDTGTRGVTYELLLTSLKQMVPVGAQKVLISAVISNAAEIGAWLIGENPVVVSGSDLLPTERAVAFASWQTQVGQLHFVTPDNPDQEEFFVPRVIHSARLPLRGKETTPRFFPAKDDSQSVGLYLALKLVRNGPVAVFCGRKASVVGLCERVLDAVDRERAVPTPLPVSDADEITRIAYLLERHLGADAAVTRAARIGLLTHHGNTPHGARLAVENAMKKGYGRFVLCTSTLAQGVNLPIRYLIVTTTRQGGEKIKVREFHNLIGRAGRSGMHTEGTILFADPSIFDTPRQSRDSAWPEFRALLKVENSEPCASTLLSVLDPLYSDGGGATLQIDPLLFVRAYVADVQGTAHWVDAAATQLTRPPYFKTEGLRRQLAQRRDILAAVESFLMAHWPEMATEDATSAAARLCERTLAYHLASPEQRDVLTAMFRMLAGNIDAQVTEPARRRMFGRTLYGVGDALALEGWVRANGDVLVECITEEDMLAATWDIIAARVQDDTFRKWRPFEALAEFAQGWIGGTSFGDLYAAMRRAKVRIGLGKRPRHPTEELMVEVGEGVLGFDAALLLGGIAEIITFVRPDAADAVELLERLQKRMRYGLPSRPAVLLYEAGFADRVVASELAALLGAVTHTAAAIEQLREKREAAGAVLSHYPRHFEEVFERVVRAP